MINTGLLYNKKYFEAGNGTFAYDWPKANEDDKKKLGAFFKQKLEELNDSVSANFSETAPYIGFPQHADLVKFTLEVKYPGIVFGTGFRHETATPNEHKLGLTFDHATGLPVAPGSSVKGFLRSAFPQYSVQVKGITPLFQQEKEESILEMAGITPEAAAARALAFLQYYLHQVPAEQLQDNIAANPVFGFVNLLEQQVFEGKVPNRLEGGTLVFEPMPVYERDVFLDVVPVALPGKAVFADDAITHHPGDTKEPNPVKFMKIGPGNYLHFQFLLKNAAAGLMDRSEKLNLFKTIFIQLGFGAKTSTGYGLLADVKNYENKWLHKSLTEQAPRYLSENEMAAYLPRTGRITKGQELAAKIIKAAANGKYEVEVHISNHQTLLRTISTEALLEPGKYILVKAKGITNNQLNSVVYDPAEQNKNN